MVSNSRSGARRQFNPIIQKQHHDTMQKNMCSCCSHFLTSISIVMVSMLIISMLVSRVLLEPRFPITTSHFDSIRAQTHPEDAEDGVPQSSVNLIKPQLILHVGPSKTATTSIQTALTHWTDYLAQDNYMYFGRYYFPDETSDLSNPKYWVRNFSLPLNATREMFMDNIPNVTLDTLVTRLQPFRGKNIIFSDEVLSFRFHKPEHYQLIRETLGEHWNVTVIVNYRRLFEWVPSIKFQRERYEEEWPWNDATAKDPGPLFPEVLHLQRRYYKNMRYTDFVIDTVNDTFPVHVINLLQGQLMIQFLCEAVPFATASCQHAILQQQQEAAAAAAAIDESDEGSTTSSTRSGSDSTSWEYLNAQPPTGNALFYDAVMIQAARDGLVNSTSCNRLTLKRAAQAYYELELGRTALDFVMVCPKKKELEPFLQDSIDMESKILNLSSSDETSPWIQDLEEKFWQYAKDSMFCWLDIEATMKEPVWIEFFTRYAGPDPALCDATTIAP